MSLTSALFFSFFFLHIICISLKSLKSNSLAKTISVWLILDGKLIYRGLPYTLSKQANYFKNFLTNKKHTIFQENLDSNWETFLDIQFQNLPLVKKSKYKRSQRQKRGDRVICYFQRVHSQDARRTLWKLLVRFISSRGDVDTESVLDV